MRFDAFISKDFIAISEDETVENAIAILRKQKTDSQSKLTYVYVINEKGQLTGVLQTRDLLLEDLSKKIQLIKKESVASVSDKSSLEQATDLFNSYPFLSAPIVDSHRRLIGIIQRKSFQPRLRHPGEQEEVEGSSVFKITLKRLPWLLISVTSGLVCSYILGIFIGKIESIVALILFVPIILGLAGNVGTQLAKVTTRGLEDAKLSVKKLLFILGKELLVGLMTGFYAFLLAATIALLWKRYPIEGIALGASIVAVSFVSGVIGIILPITFRTFKMSSNFAPRLFLLLICDIVALLVYFLISLSLVSPTLVIT